MFDTRLIWIAITANYALCILRYGIVDGLGVGTCTLLLYVMAYFILRRFAPNLWW